MSESTFTGDQKAPLVSPLARVEDRFLRWLLPHFPRWMQGNHLTLMTILWSAGVVLAGWLARGDLRWLWLSSAMLVLQWFTDSFDGKLGKLRNLGIRRWGYFMDHFLDYVFLMSIIGGYGLLIVQVREYWWLALMGVSGAFMVNTFLSFAATNEFRISILKVGPTEMRLFFILVNTAIIFFDTAWVAFSIPYVAAGFTLALAWSVFTTQRLIWRLDMDLKRSRSANPEN